MRLKEWVQQKKEYHRVNMLRSVPKGCSGSVYARIQVSAQGALAKANRTDNDMARARAWTLLLLLPQLLLYPLGRGGEAGTRALRRRISRFDAGQWGDLFADRRQSAGQRGRRPARSQQDQLEARARAGNSLIEQGELSHAVRALRSSRLAVGSDATLCELCDPA